LHEKRSGIAGATLVDRAGHGPGIEPGFGGNQNVAVVARRALHERGAFAHDGRAAGQLARERDPA
jgi:hypothetical protein